MSKPTEKDKTERREPDATFVPARRRPETAIAPPGTVHSGPLGPTIAPPDSYQPQISRGTAGASITPATHRELLVPSTSSVDTILQEIRRPHDERLEVEGRAAAGGMGSIDIAVDRALDRRVALKSLHAHLRTSESTVRMFLREARLTALLDHPNIVPVYDIGERTDEHLYFAMKLVDGRTLSEVINELPPSLDTSTLFTLLDVVIKVCDALAFAHSRGVLHCDIKPANVMVGEFGAVYVMDWGIARMMAAELSPSSSPGHGTGDGDAALGSATDNSVIGTPCYMSPEQARGDRAKLDPRSDVFLIGSLLYEILTRRPP